MYLYLAMVLLLSFLCFLALRSCHYFTYWGFHPRSVVTSSTRTLLYVDGRFMPCRHSFIKTPYLVSRSFFILLANSSCVYRASVFLSSRTRFYFQPVDYSLPRPDLRPHLRPLSLSLVHFCLATSRFHLLNRLVCRCTYSHCRCVSFTFT